MQAPDVTRPELEWELAITLNQLGEDPARARALATEARAALLGADPVGHARAIASIAKRLTVWP